MPGAGGLEVARGRHGEQLADVGRHRRRIEPDLAPSGDQTLAQAPARVVLAHVRRQRAGRP
jgi:hypothetical protein